MKDSRFIELLNLYIDRQISADETTELEAEIQRNPKRQAVYRQYCQIHCATKQVYATFRTHADDQPVAASGQAGVIELFESRRRRTNWAYYAGGLAAAACLALVFVRTQPVAPATPVLAQAKSQPDMTVAARPVATPVSVVTAEHKPGLLSLQNAVAVSPDYSAMLAVLREKDEERAFNNERLYVGGTQSLFGDQAFESQHVLPPQEQRVYRSRQAPANQGQAEFTAFQFQR